MKGATYVDVEFKAAAVFFAGVLLISACNGNDPQSFGLEPPLFVPCASLCVSASQGNSIRPAQSVSYIIVP